MHPGGNGRAARWAVVVSLVCLAFVLAGCTSSSVFVHGSGWTGCMTTKNAPWGTQTNPLADYSTGSVMLARFGNADEAFVFLESSPIPMHTTPDGFGCDLDQQYLDLVGQKHITFEANGPAAVSTHYDPPKQVDIPNVGQATQVWVVGQGQVTRHAPGSMATGPKPVTYRLMLRRFDDVALFDLLIGVDSPESYSVSGRVDIAGPNEPVKGDIVFLD